MHESNSALERLLGGEENPFDWREYYFALKDRLWIVVLCLVLAGNIAWLYLAFREMPYRARAVLFIEQEQSRVLGTQVQTVRDEQIRSVDMINTMVDLLRGYPFALRVAARLKLDANQEFLDAAGEKDKKISVNAAAGLLLDMVTAQYREETRLIDILATSRDPDIAVLLANAYADEYLRYIFEQRASAVRSANQFLIDEAERLRRKMRDSEQAMQSFRERERAASLETMQEDTQARLTDVTTRQVQTEERIAQLDSDLATARANQGDMQALLKLPSVAAEPKVAQLNAVIVSQEQEFEMMTRRYRPKHPAYLATQTRLELTRQDRKKLLEDIVSLLEANRKQLQSQAEELAKTQQDYEERLLKITGKSVEYNVLKRELESDKALYDSVIERLKEVDITKGLDQEAVTIHERALGAGPVKINLFILWGLVIVGGAFAGVGIALSLHYLDHSAKTIDQIERWSGTDVVAAVPRIKTKKGERVGLVVTQERSGVVAEAFRTARTAIALQSGKEQRQVFLFTSALPSEGKTFSSSNFAATLAQQGFRTLYIDSDLRKPEVSRLFFGEHRKPGLSEILLGRSALKDAVLDTKVPNLRVLTAGGRARNPSELLAMRSLQALVEQARKEYDRIVIDSAPVIAVSDTLLVVPLADACCIVVRAFSTPKNSILRAIRLLSDVGRRPSGIIFNRLPDERGAYYYYSGRYHHGYGAKNVYSDDRPEMPAAS